MQVQPLNSCLHYADSEVAAINHCAHRLKLRRFFGTTSIPESHHPAPEPHGDKFRQRGD